MLASKTLFGLMKKQQQQKCAYSPNTRHSFTQSTKYSLAKQTRTKSFSVNWIVNAPTLVWVRRHFHTHAHNKYLRSKEKTIQYPQAHNAACNSTVLCTHANAIFYSVSFLSRNCIQIFDSAISANANLSFWKIRKFLPPRIDSMRCMSCENWRFT